MGRCAVARWLVVAVLLGEGCLPHAVGAPATPPATSAADVIERLVSASPVNFAAALESLPLDPDLKRGPTWRSDGAPTDAAPLEQLLAFWSAWRAAQPKPTPVVLERLLTAAAFHPHALEWLARLLPHDDVTRRRVAGSLAQLRLPGGSHERWIRERVRDAFAAAPDAEGEAADQGSPSKPNPTEVAERAVRNIRRADATGKDIVDALFSAVGWSFGPREAAVLVALDARLPELQRTCPAGGRVLLVRLIQWGSPRGLSALLDQLRTGPSTGDTMSSMDHREALRRDHGADLAALAADGRASPVGRGVAAALLADDAPALRLLEGANELARSALLATARLFRRDLPLASVARALDSSSDLTRRAARAYLEAGRSLDGWREVERRAPRGSYLVHGGDSSVWEPGEAALVRAFRARRSADEVLALVWYQLVSYGPETRWRWELWSSGPEVRLNRVEELPLDGDVVTETRLLTAAEAAWCRSALDRIDVDRLGDLGYFEGNETHQPVANIVHLTRARGRRIAVMDPGNERIAGSPHSQLFALSGWLTWSGTYEPLALAALRRLSPAARVVAGNEDLAVQGVAVVGGRRWVLACKNPWDRRYYRPLRWYEPEGSTWRERGWAGFLAARLCPAEASWDDEVGPSGFGFAWQPALRYVPRTRPLSEEASDCTTPEGWKRVLADGRLQTLVDGPLEGSVMSPDGAWLVVSRREGDDYPGRQRILCCATATGATSVARVAPTTDVLPLAWVQAHQAVLVRRGQGRRVNHWLVAPSTGGARPTTGEFWPYEQAPRRALQHIGEIDHQAWAARPLASGTGSEVGVYDTKRFTYRRVFELPGVSVRSEDVWIDLGSETLLLAVDHSLFELPLGAVWPRNRRARDLRTLRRRRAPR